MPSILLPDEMDTLLSHDSVALTIRLLGASLDLILDRTTELQFLHSSYTHIVQCLKSNIYYFVTLLYARLISC